MPQGALSMSEATLLSERPTWGTVSRSSGRPHRGRPRQGTGGIGGRVEPVTEPLLGVHAIDVRYGPSQALFGVSFDVPPGASWPCSA